MIPESYGGNSLLILLGLIALIIIFVVVFRVTSERNPPPFSTKACPVCKGGGKIPDQAHNSGDIQFINCARCGGSGEVDASDNEEGD